MTVRSQWCSVRGSQDFYGYRLDLEWCTSNSLMPIARNDARFDLADISTSAFTETYGIRCAPLLPVIKTRILDDRLAKGESSSE